MIRMTYIDLADIVYERSRFDFINLSQAEEIASRILAVGGLVYPLIVEQIHFTAFQLIDYRDNYLKFKAALTAYQIDSRQDIINCIVMSAESGTGYEHAHPKALIEKQLSLLSARKLNPNSTQARLDVMQVEINKLQAGFNSLRTSL